jgi:shikimate kinase
MTRADETKGRTRAAKKRATRCVVVTGFMAAGKTTVARALARLLDCDAVDLDELITTREGHTPQQLIDEDGEPSFRDAETRALVAALDSEESCVIATGGGTWTFERNRALVNASDCLSVWLDAPFNLCWQRIEAAGNTRPLARERESARRLFDERLAAYSLAELRVRATEERTAEELAREIAEAACA